MRRKDTLWHQNRIFISSMLLEEVIELFTRALTLVGQNFAPRGHRIGITPMLRRCLKEAGAVNLTHVCHAIDYSSDTQVYEGFVNVPPGRSRRLLRSLPRWPRPDRKCFVSQVQNHLRRRRIPVQFTPARAGVPPLVYRLFAKGSTVGTDL
jgi:hypothetical protein